MGQINVTVGGHHYLLACRDGEESHLNRLANMLNSKSEQLREQLGAMPENRMLLMAGILLADELAETHDDVSSGPQDSAQIDQILDQATDRIKKITGLLEKRSA